jgi:hypothetical protein
LILPRSEKTLISIGWSDNFQSVLAPKVVIENKNGRGKLVIQYSDLDVLDGILNRIE